ncbi:hypothetical protein GY45DRAFT_1368441 [Cubamyces sp. BRFM 1775]|nr:hypothetical protein GY45DRAFT_1368441 [Cubamyces sp. BRFM 1775]
MAQAASSTVNFMAGRDIDYVNPYLSTRRIHLIDNLSVMLDDFIDAEQDAITYHGPLREYIPSHFERAEVQVRPRYEAPAFGRYSSAWLYGKATHPFLDDEDDMDMYDSDEDGPWGLGCPSLTTDDDSSDSAFSSEAESDSSSFYTDSGSEWEPEEDYETDEPEVVEVSWEEWEQLRELRGGVMRGILPASELWGRGVQDVDADEYPAFDLDA